MQSNVRTMCACLASVEAETIRPTHMNATTFEAWRLDGSANIATAISLPTDEAANLAAVLSVTAPNCHHKDQLVIVETSPTGKIAHFYQIKQGKREYRRDPVTGTCGFVSPLYPSALFSMAVRDFTPVEPWAWAPGADVVGLRGGAIDA